MEADRFKQVVSRLERQSAAAPGLYRAKVAALALLGFGILALLLGGTGLLLCALLGVAVALMLNGGAALLLLFKLGKLLFIMAIPLWYLIKSAARAAFVRLPKPEGREIQRFEAPALFATLEQMRRQMKGPPVHHVLIVDEVNAAIVQRPAFGLFGWPRNYLLLGLPLLECMPPAEAQAVIAHEYGHLAGAHGRFAAFIYRLRHTWGTVQTYTDQIEGWLGRLVSPLVRWYAPYFNAYTFVLARANEYQADAAAAELVGAAHAADALKRANLIGSKHRRFMKETFDRIDHEPAPPADLMHRWAERAGEAPPEADTKSWLSEALDREGHFTDSHPTLRARLEALSQASDSIQDAPPALAGPSAAQAWLGSAVERLRADFQAQWLNRVAEPWAQRHAESQQQRGRLNQLRALPERDVGQHIEMLRLSMRLEPETDWREPLAAFNAAHADHALGLFLEGIARLDKGDREGLGLLDRAVKLDPEATKPVCERALSFLMERKEREAAEAYAERWRQRDQLESERALQLKTLDPSHELAAHGLDAQTVSILKSRLAGKARSSIGDAYVARRVIPADPSVVQLVMGVKLTWWGRRLGKQQAVLKRLAAMDWPVPLVFVMLEGKFARMGKKFRHVADAKLTA